MQSSKVNETNMCKICMDGCIVTADSNILPADLPAHVCESWTRGKHMGQTMSSRDVLSNLARSNSSKRTSLYKYSSHISS